MRIKSELILVDVSVKLFRSQNFGDLHKLIVVVTTLEEGLPLENHTGEHASQRPNIQRVIVSLQIDEKLRSFEVARGDANVVFLTWVIKFSQTPINESQFAVGVIDHDVVRFYVSVHNALRVTEIKCLQDLEHIVANIEVVKALVKFAEISVTGIDKFSNNGWRLSERVTNNINQIDNVDSVLQGLQNFNFASDFVLLNYRLTIVH